MTSLADASPDQMRQALAAIVGEHLPEAADTETDSPWTRCFECGLKWPCFTVRAVTDAGIEVTA